VVEMKNTILIGIALVLCMVLLFGCTKQQNTGTNTPANGNGNVGTGSQAGSGSTGSPATGGQTDNTTTGSGTQTPPAGSGTENITIEPVKDKPNTTVTQDELNKLGQGIQKLKPEDLGSFS
jgi:hypothetical protein